MDFIPPRFVALMLAAFLLAAHPAGAEYYRYVNEAGEIRFVDRLDKIPPQYRQQATAYQEQYDNLSPPQRRRMQELERRRVQEKTAAQIARDEILEQYRVRQRQIEEQEAREKELRRLETKVTVQGNRILVPVKLGQDRREVEINLILDTGATTMVLHRDVANRLGLRGKRSIAHIAGGGTIPVDRAVLESLEVGPYRSEDITTLIVDYKGLDLGYSGLLGMNFLQHVDYRIDYGRQVIRWQAVRQAPQP